jgi:arylsulfatase A-like enzyme
MPMLVRWPAGIAAGTTSDAMVTNVDFAATFLDLAELDPDVVLPTSQGRSFLPILQTPEQVDDWPEAVYYRYWEHDDPIHHAPAHYGIRTKKHKLIHYYGAGLGVPGASDQIFDPEWELYDLTADPDEMRNVADDPAYAQVRARLEETLERMQRHYADEPYRGADTPVPDWAWADEHMIELVHRYVAAMDMGSDTGSDLGATGA